jgi:hypothetical protein
MELDSWKHVEMRHRTRHSLFTKSGSLNSAISYLHCLTIYCSLERYKSWTVDLIKYTVFPLHSSILRMEGCPLCMPHLQRCVLQPRRLTESIGLTMLSCKSARPITIAMPLTYGRVSSDGCPIFLSQLATL